MVTRKTVLVDIRARANQAIGQVKKMAGALDKMRTSAQSAAKKGMGELAKENEKLNKAFDKGIKTLKKFRGALAMGGAALATIKVLDSITARARELNIVFDNTPFSVAKASDAVGGLVSRFELSKLAIAANRFEVAKNEEDFAKLARAGALLARTMGRDARSGVEDLSLALARGSPKILDNLGVILSLGEANRIYAKRLGKTVKELTEAEKKTAFMTVGLERANAMAKTIAVSTDKYADSSGRLKRLLTDLADSTLAELGKSIDKYLSLMERVIDVNLEAAAAVAAVASELSFDVFGRMSDEEEAEAADRRIAAESRLVEARRAGIAKAEKENREARLKARKGMIAEDEARIASAEAQEKIQKRIKEAQDKSSRAAKKRLRELKAEMKMLEGVRKAIEAAAKAQKESDRSAQEAARQSIASVESTLARAGGVRAGIGGTPEAQSRIEFDLQKEQLEREKELINERFEAKRRAADELFEFQLLDQERRNELRENDAQMELLAANRERERFQERRSRQEEAAKEMTKQIEKDAKKREKVFLATGNVVVSTFTAMGDSFREAGEAGLLAGDRIAAGLAAGTKAMLKEIQNQLRVLAASEIAKAAAAVAGQNFLAAGKHSVAAGLAAAGAGLAGGLAAAVSSTPSGSSARGQSTERDQGPVGPIAEEERGRQRQAQQGRGTSGSGGDTFIITQFGTLDEDNAREFARQTDRARRSA